MELEEALRHAGPIWTGERQHDLERRARQALPHYMFTYQRDKKKVGYCTNCLNYCIPINPADKIPDWVAEDPYADDEESEYRHHPERQYGFAGPYESCFPLDGSGTHKHFGDCPVCGCRVQYRGLGMGRKALSDRIFLIQYRRSTLDENALVMTGWLAICDWGKWDDYNERLPEMYLDLREICVFQPGKAGDRFTKHVWFMGQEGESGKLFSLPMADWRHNKQCKSYFDPWGGCMGNVSDTRYMLDEDTVGDAIAGTWMEPVYAEMKDCGSLDRIDLMEALHRYPCIEYLWKLGFRTLARSLADGSLDKRVINTRGKTAQKVLKVDGDFYGWLKGNRIDPTSQLLRMYRAARNLKLRVGNEKLLRMSRNWSPESLQEICDFSGRGTLEKTVNYILKRSMAAWEYIDHLKIMRDLGMDMKDPAMLWPRNFQEIHTELAARRKIKANEAKAEKLFKRVDALAGWWFSALGLTIRPFLTPDEIIREGNEMHHCVGGYVDSYLGGHTVLLALREDERPGKPWRTVEYTPKGQLVQCRGYRNKSPEDEQPRIDEFFRLFAAYRAEYERLNGKKKGRRAA